MLAKSVVFYAVSKNVFTFRENFFGNYSPNFHLKRFH